jgi:phosphatidylglycerophosphatase A
VIDIEGDVKTPLSRISRGFPLAIATAAGVGFMPLAPGTFGSVVGVALFFPLASGGLASYLAWTAVLAGLGVWASGRAEEIFGHTDDGRIVIDEVVGQLIVLTPLVAIIPGIPGIPGDSIDGNVFYLLIVTGFVTFRVLDIYKPGVIRWTERNISGGAGVMADDCVAGVFGAVGLAIPTAGILWWGMERVTH